MRTDENKRYRTMVRILIWVIVVLVLIMAYFFLVRPQLNNYAVNNQIAGANIVYQDIVNNVQTNGYYAIPIGNQTLILVPYVPEQTGITQ